MTTRHPEPPGSLALGPYSSSAFGVHLDTTLSEMSLEAVPLPVLAAVDAWVGPSAFCARYFDGGDAVVVHGPSNCVYRVVNGFQAPGPDHSPVAAFDLQGEMLGVPFSDYMDAEFRIEPWFRFLRTDTLARSAAGPDGKTAFDSVEDVWNIFADVADGQDLPSSITEWAVTKESRFPGFFSRTAGCLRAGSSFDLEQVGRVVVGFSVPDPAVEQTPRRLEFVRLGAEVELTEEGWSVLRMADAGGRMWETGSNLDVCP